MTEAASNENLTYRKAGVDIDAGTQLVQRIKPAIKATRRPGVMGGIGGFGGLFELPWGDYQAPVLVSGTDGVGTKLRLAIDAGRHEKIGIDLVAMCVNDIIVTGAEPLFFLDYFATGQLDLETATSVIGGIATGCQLSGAALIGGETAEMPGMYHDGDYDLAGFAVGMVEKAALIDNSKVTSGDAIIGLASSGPHSNGYSLIRSVLDRAASPVSQTIIDALLEPTRIYVKPILELLSAMTPINALAHITGGGLTENIPRVLRPGQVARLDPGTWNQPEIFKWLQSVGQIEQAEMYRVFNCGIGMIAIVPAADKDTILQRFLDAGETAWHIGEIVDSGNQIDPAEVTFI